MIITALDEIGIRATFAEITPMHIKATNHPTQSAIVYVIETDLVRARSAIDEFTAPSDHEIANDEFIDDEFIDDLADDT